MQMYQRKVQTGCCYFSTSKNTILLTQKSDFKFEFFSFQYFVKQFHLFYFSIGNQLVGAILRGYQIFFCSFLNLPTYLYPIFWPIFGHIYLSISNNIRFLQTYLLTRTSDILYGQPLTHLMFKHPVALLLIPEKPRRRLLVL